MPAIHPARLKIQAAQLAETFQQPAAFVRGLHALLTVYADRAYRPGQSGEPPLLTPAYNTPIPVLRRVEMELAPWIDRDAHAALALADALWAENVFECRTLAAHLLGKLPVDRQAAVLRRVKEWAEAGCEERLLNALVQRGLAGLRQHAPDRVFMLIENWLLGETGQVKIGLAALLPIIEDLQFTNLPALYKLINPFLSQANSDLHPELLPALAALARRSPQEMAYALQQHLELPEHPDTAWLIRQLLPVFPADIQHALRPAGRGAAA